MWSSTLVCACANRHDTVYGACMIHSLVLPTTNHHAACPSVGCGTPAPSRSQDSPSPPLPSHLSCLPRAAKRIQHPRRWHHGSRARLVAVMRSGARPAGWMRAAMYARCAVMPIDDPAPVLHCDRVSRCNNGNRRRGLSAETWANTTSSLPYPLHPYPIVCSIDRSLAKLPGNHQGLGARPQNSPSLA